MLKGNVSPQSGQRSRTVLVLGSTLGGEADHAGRLMGQADGGVGLVAVLTARAGDAESFEPALVE